MLTEGKMDDGVGLEILCELPDFVGTVDVRHPNCFLQLERSAFP